MKATLLIEVDEENQYVINLNKKELKILLNLQVDIEKTYCHGSNVREKQEADPRLQLLYKINQWKTDQLKKQWENGHNNS